MILGQGERGRTRSQTRKISESGEEEKKPAVKRVGTMEETIKVRRECYYYTHIELMSSYPLPEI